MQNSQRRVGPCTHHSSERTPATEDFWFPHAAPSFRIIAGKKGVFWAEVDLNKREALDWVDYWRSIGPRHRMQNTLQELLKAPQSPTY